MSALQLQESGPEPNLAVVTADEVVLPGSDNQLTRQEIIITSMLKSIARTAFGTSGPELIPGISGEVLSSGNIEVRSKFPSPRQLQIVGPDVVQFDHLSPVRLQGQWLGELLALLIEKRKMLPVETYLEAGFAEDINQEIRAITLSSTLDALLSTVVDIHGRAVAGRHRAKKGRNKTELQLGMVDVEVHDLRLSPEYEEARFANTLINLQNFMEGGQVPDISEPGSLRAAKQVQDEFKSRGRRINNSQRTQLRVLSELIAGQEVTHLTKDSQGTNKGSMAPEKQTAESSMDAFMAKVKKPDWTKLASCLGSQRYLFFPPEHYEYKIEKEAREARAKATCATCPVRQPCLDTAIKNREKEGIWGGLNEKERRRLRRNRA